MRLAASVISLVLLLGLGAPLAAAQQATPEATPLPGATPSPGAGHACDAASGGLIVNQEFDRIGGSQGTPASITRMRIVARTPDGQEVSRLTAPATSSLQPRGIGCLVLVGWYRSSDGPDPGPPLLFDPATGASIPLAFAGGGQVPDRLFPLIGFRRTFHEQRWTLLQGDTPPSAYLLDTHNGRLIDLLSVIRDLKGTQQASAADQPLAAQFTPDERYLVLETSDGSWVVATNALRNGARIPRGLGVSICEDGRHVAYTRLESGTASLVTSELIGDLSNAGTTIATSKDPTARAFFVPGASCGALLTYLDGEIALRDLAGGAQTPIGTIPGGAIVTRAIFAPGGRQALLAGRDGDQAVYAWADLDKRTLTRLSDLDGQYLLPSLPAGDPAGVTARWLWFLPSPTPVVKPGQRVSALNVETGGVQPALQFSAQAVVGANLRIVSASGRYLLLSRMDSTVGSWLLDATKPADAQLPLQPNRLGLGFSPDEQRLLIEHFDPTAGSGAPHPIALADLSGHEVGNVAPDGSYPFWVPLAPAEG